MQVETGDSHEERYFIGAFADAETAEVLRQLAAEHDGSRSGVKSQKKRPQRFLLARDSFTYDLGSCLANIANVVSIACRRNAELRCFPAPRYRSDTRVYEWQDGRTHIHDQRQFLATRDRA